MDYQYQVFALLLALVVGSQAYCLPGTVGSGSYRTNGDLSVYLSATTEKADAYRLESCCPSGYRPIFLNNETKDNSLHAILLDGFGGIPFWTSGIRISDNVWNWQIFGASGEDDKILVVYTNWNLYAHEPDVALDKEACIGVAQTNWYDSECINVNQVICEAFP